MSRVAFLWKKKPQMLRNSIYFSKSINFFVRVCRYSHVLFDKADENHVSILCFKIFRRSDMEINVDNCKVTLS